MFAPMNDPQQFLSPEDVAEALNLNVRTIRRYIRDGRLAATRIGKQYRIAASDFRAFAGAEQPAERAAAAPRARRVLVSATTDIHAISPAESGRVEALLTGAFTAQRGRPGAHLECIYYEETGTLRVVVNADLAFTSTVLGLIDAVVSDDSREGAGKETE
jgi:excisionase family DNA binding protein